MLDNIISNEITSISHSSGDPHIKTINGVITELPNKSLCYRYLQGEDLIINIGTRFFTIEEKLCFVSAN